MSNSQPNQWVVLNLVEARYGVECTNCGAKGYLRYPSGIGWVVGSMIPEDPSDSKIGRCHICLSHQMKVTEVPPPPPPPKVEGFDKVPEK